MAEIIEMTNSKPLPRMRTLPQAIEELKALDPNTCLTLSTLRRLVKTGAVKCIQCGRLSYVNLDLLIDYLQNPTAPNTQISTGIRKIAE